MRSDDPWSVQDPAAMIAAAMSRRRPRADDVLVAMLSCGDLPEQEVLDVVRVNRGVLPSRIAASDQLHELGLRLAGDRTYEGRRWSAPDKVFVTLVFRHGRVVPGPAETFWLMAWRYSNHNSTAFDGDVYLVTDHGWTGCLDHRAGFEPRLAGTSRRLAAVAPVA